MTVRFSPSRVSYDRCFSRPETMTREPRWRDSATCSAAWRHTVQARKSGSPSFHSLVALSMNRGVEATRNLATAAPDGVKRSSGSSVRLPMTVIVVSPAMVTPRTHYRCRDSRCHTGVTRRNRTRSGVLADFRTDDLGTQHRLVESQLTVQLGDGFWCRLKIDDGVDALGLLVDLIRKASTSPDVELLHGSTRRPDHIQVRVE